MARQGAAGLLLSALIAWLSLAAGIVKMTAPTAFTTTMLAWSMLSFPKAYIAAGTVDRTMSQIGWVGFHSTMSDTLALRHVLSKLPQADVVQAM